MAHGNLRFALNARAFCMTLSIVTGAPFKRLLSSAASMNAKSSIVSAALTGATPPEPAAVAAAPAEATHDHSEAPAADEAPVSTQGPQIQAILREQELDKYGRAYATGRRKNAIARVWLKPGSGKVMVNGKTMKEYFARPVLQMILAQAFTVANVEGQFDVMATVAGGGLSGQAGAVKHGISVALQRYEPGLRAALKAAGFLTRDSRVVERKKYGKAKARKSFQFSKR